MTNLRKRGSSWQVDLRRYGAGQKSFKTRALAERWIESYQQHGSAPQDDPQVSWGSFVEQSISKLWVNQSYQQSNISYLKHFTERVGHNTRLSDITPYMYAEMIESLAERYAPSTVNKVTVAVRMVLQRAVRHGHLENINGFDWSFRKDTRGRLRYLTDDEESSLLDYFEITNPEYARYITVLLDTGARPVELLRTKPTDISPVGHNRPQINLQETKTDTPRAIPLTSRALEAVRTQIEVVPMRFLFEFNYRNFKTSWDRYRTEVGLKDDPDFVPYICRHTCATRMAIKGVDPLRIKKWMGHKSLKTTERYTHLSTSDLDDCLSALG